MATFDFIMDAAESLDKSDDIYILIGAQEGVSGCITCAHVPTVAQLEWMREKFEELCDRIAECQD